MKNDLNENEIFARIKQKLDTYQEDYIPGSWENFQQRGKSRKRVLFLRIASGIAACLLLGLIGTEWFFKVSPEKVSLTTETTAVQKPESQEDILASAPSNAAAPAKSTTSSPLALMAKVQAGGSGRTTKKPVAAFQSNIVPAGTKNLALAEKDQTVVPNVSRANDTKHDSLKNVRDTVRVRPVFVAENSAQQVDTRNPATIRQRKVRFGVTFSPGVSTARSSSSFNFTGGVSADIALVSNVQLSTGLQVENQNIVRKNPGLTSYAMASSDFATSYKPPQSESRTIMVNLDIPVNLTWKFKSEKSSAYYVSAGLSSLVYLRQDNKNTTYTQDLVPVSTVVGGTEVKSFSVVNQVSVVENSGAPDQIFDFAGRINLMFGFEKRLSDKLFIHVEPYAKIPASGLAPSNLNQPSTGINFKISF